MQIILIGGKARSGKDTIADFMSDLLEKEGKKGLVLSSTGQVIINPEYSELSNLSYIYHLLSGILSNSFFSRNLLEPWRLFFDFVTLSTEVPVLVIYFLHK